MSEIGRAQCEPATEGWRKLACMASAENPRRPFEAGLQSLCLTAAAAPRSASTCCLFEVASYHCFVAFCDLNLAWIIACAMAGSRSYTLRFRAHFELPGRFACFSSVPVRAAPHVLLLISTLPIYGVRLLVAPTVEQCDANRMPQRPGHSPRRSGILACQHDQQDSSPGDSHKDAGCTDLRRGDAGGESGIPPTAHPGSNSK